MLSEKCRLCERLNPVFAPLLINFTPRLDFRGYGSPGAAKQTRGFNIVFLHPGIASRLPGYVSLERFLDPVQRLAKTGICAYLKIVKIIKII